MEALRILCKYSFWLVLGGLVAFCLLFGTPFVAKIAAGKVVAAAGCTAPSFDMQAICPEGSYAEKFIPLSHWFTSGMAPFILMQNFSGLLFAWAALSAALGTAWQILSSRSTKNL